MCLASRHNIRQMSRSPLYIEVKITTVLWGQGHNCTLGSRSPLYLEVKVSNVPGVEVLNAVQDLLKEWWCLLLTQPVTGRQVLEQLTPVHPTNRRMKISTLHIDRWKHDNQWTFSNCQSWSFITGYCPFNVKWIRATIRWQCYIFNTKESKISVCDKLIKKEHKESTWWVGVLKSCEMVLIPKGNTSFMCVWCGANHHTLKKYIALIIQNKNCC